MAATGDAAAVGGGAACGRRGEERRTGSPAGRRSRVRGRGAAPDGVELGGPSVPAAAALKRAGVPEDEMANLERQLAPGPSTAPPAPSTANRMMNFVSAGVQAQAESSSRQQQAAAA
uniref:Uncharacterized protein n=1 Tax=Oryza sativa subsp. japonica TaxID=39947 RepID=Q2RBC0_ORYSJ|nr:hypothetical protein LOC_Os11g02510 [Oryza sativa Japonica Group]